VPGNAVLNSNWRRPVSSPSNHVVTGLDVMAASDTRVIVAFGDSITEGAGSRDREAVPMRYPDRLAARLRPATGRAGRFAVVNAGISGNRLLADVVGPKGLARFDRDVLWQSGVTHVVILIGINDIGFSLPEGSAPAVGLPSADQITMGLQQLIQRARDKGVKVLLGTLLPFRGAGYWSEEKEARRQAVNRWIRGRTDVDAVVDFDAVLRNPGRPDTLSAFYDSGDHLHPGNAGYAAMAGAIDLRELEE
jgi:lysophospholipase L1-like esterase